MAIDPRTSRFWQETLRSGLLDEAALRACWEAIPEEKREAEAIDRRMARQAIAAELLTLWQAQQVLAGRSLALKVGKYVVRDVIGRGGMGLVFLAHDTRLHRPVAIKVLSRERMNSPRALVRFEREAKVGAQLQHDNLVRIYDAGEFRDLRYLVMEYIEGRNVAQLLGDLGRLPPTLAASIGRQVALGLEHARLKGLIHRDVNPQNILVTRDGTAKLTDLGLAIDLGDPDDVVTRDGATVGTFDYISPEQARHPRSVDTRSDLYSLGCALYHMIAGRPPFPAASLPEKLYAHQLHQPEPLTSLAPEAPPGLEAIVGRLMAKAPDDRFQTPQELAEALEPMAEGARALAAMLAAPRRAEEDAAAGAPGPGSVGPMGPSDGNGNGNCDRLGPAAGRDLPPTRTSSSLRPEGRVARPEVAAVTPSDSDPGSGPLPAAGPRSPEGRSTEAEPDTAAGPASVLGLAIDLGPELSLTESLSVSRSRSRASASRSGSGTGSSDKEPAAPAAGPPRSPGTRRRRLAVVLAAAVVPAAILALVVARPRLGGGEGAAGPPAGSDPAVATPDAPADPAGVAASGAAGSGFGVGRQDGSGVIPCANLQEALSLAPNNGGTVFVGEASGPIRIGPGQPAFLAPRSSIVVRPRPGTRPVLTVWLEGREPWLRQQSGGLTLEGLTVLVNYRARGGGQADAPRPPLIEANGELTIRRCVLAVQSGAGGETCAVRSAGTGTLVVGSLFRGFDRPLDLVAYAGMRHDVSGSIFVWPRGTAGSRPGWAVRIASKTSSQSRPARLSIDRCTVIRGAGLIEATALVPEPPLEIRVAGSGVRADHLLAWAPPAEGDAFPAGLGWEGTGNRYDLQGNTWVVSSADGLTAPESSPTDLDSWLEALGAGSEDDSEPALVELPDKSALESDTLDPARFAARSGDEPIGADPSEVGPPGATARRDLARGR